MSKTAKTRTQLLDAALHCYHAKGIQSTANSDIAEVAGVGIATLYRHFAGKDEILQEVLVRDYLLFLERFEAVRKRPETIKQQFSEGVFQFLEEIRFSHGLRLLFSEESAYILNRINIKELFTHAVSFRNVKPLFEQLVEDQHIRKNISLDDFSEWMTFILLSLLSTPNSYIDNPKKMRHMLDSFLTPSVLKDI